MITIEGKKMGKSYNNFITLEQFFTGNHPLLERPISPMVIRFFILQAHYRSPLDFSNKALEASEKALQKLSETYKRLGNLKASEKSSAEMPDFIKLAYEAMDDDMNTAQVISQLFEASRIINSAAAGDIKLSKEDIETLKKLFDIFFVELLGMNIIGDAENAGSSKAFENAVDLLMEIRSKAKSQKDWETSDLIRNKLTEFGFDIKDTKNGVEWSVK